MRTAALLTGVVLLSAPAHAQQVGEFRVHAHIDLPAAMEFVYPSKGPLVIHGWAFECQSGLQPQTERAGTIGVTFVNTTSGEEYTPRLGSVHLFNGSRPDVGRAFQAACPALGSNAGYALVVDDLPPPGPWQIRVFVGTFNGRRQPKIAPIQTRTIFVVHESIR